MGKVVKIPEDSNSATINIVLDTLKINKQALVFVNTKKSAEKSAEDISKKIKTNSKELLELGEKAAHVLSKPTKQCDRLARCLKKGVAFHHAGLTQAQKDLIEENFKSGKVKVICATPTLAMGVDLPAFRAVIKDLKRFTQHGLSWIPVLEYLQMAGRAGRPNYDKEGQAIVIALTENEKEKLTDKYINGDPEEIYSKLAVEPALRTYVLSLIASNFATTKKSLLEFFDQTFYAHQFKDLRRLHGTINKVIDLLDEWEFIMRSGDDFASADELEDEKFKATLLGKRVAELYIDPLTANFIITCMRNGSDRRVEDFSFLQVVSHTLEIRPMLRVGVREYDKIQEGLLALSDLILEEEPSMYEPEYEEFLSSIKTALMFRDWITEKDEEFLLEEYNIRPGEVKAKIDIADWLLYTAEELCRILHFQSMIKEIIKLRLRLKYGVKEELLPLIRIEGVGRVRARKLYYNKLRDLKDVKNADVMTLKQILGDKIALKIKHQLGQEIKEVKGNKRKGQISLGDY